MYLKCKIVKDTDVCFDNDKNRKYLILFIPKYLIKIFLITFVIFILWCNESSRYIIVLILRIRAIKSGK